MIAGTVHHFQVPVLQPPLRPSTTATLYDRMTSLYDQMTSPVVPVAVLVLQSPPIVDRMTGLLVRAQVYKFTVSHPLPGSARPYPLQTVRFLAQR